MEASERNAERIKRESTQHALKMAFMVGCDGQKMMVDSIYIRSLSPLLHLTKTSLINARDEEKIHFISLNKEHSI